MKQYLPDYEWFLIDAMLGPIANDNFLYGDMKEFSCSLGNFRCSLVGREPLPIYVRSPFPPHTNREQLDPAFADSPLFTLAGFQGGDDAA